MSKSLSGNDDSDFEAIDCTDNNSDFGQSDSENSETPADYINAKTSSKKSSTSIQKYEESCVAVTLLSGSPTFRHDDAVNSLKNTSESLLIIPHDSMLYNSNVDTYNHTDSNETQGTFFG